MHHSLYGKLAAVLMVLLVVVGVGGVMSTLWTTRHYLEEVDQKLNRSLAADLVAEYPLLEEGRIREENLEHVFHMLMVINPRIEVYLLDPEGRILAFSAPPGKVTRERVSLEPIRAFLAGARLPLRGDDPRDATRRKIFSASPIPAAGRGEDALEGYLYVVLIGEQYDSVVEMLRASYVLRLSSWTTVAVLAVTLGAGLALFRFLTLRLKRLDRRMQGLEADLSDPSEPAAASAAAGDEIDRLEQTFRTMAARIVRQMDALKRADQLRRELVVNVSHDLRTPLASLRGYLETLLLKESTLPAGEQRRYLEIALTQSERLSTLVAELFELAKLDAEETCLDLEEFSLAELAQDVTQKFQLAAAGRGIALHTELPRGLPFVSADIHLVERVFENLLENALRHTGPGGRIEVALAARGDRVEVRVSDTGSGIAPQEIPRIFDRFYRGGDEDERREGAGLGLAIAKRILELHGSGIDVESTVGEGTAFCFELAA